MKFSTDTKMRDAIINDSVNNEEFEKMMDQSHLDLHKEKDMVTQFLKDNDLYNSDTYIIKLNKHNLKSMYRDKTTLFSIVSSKPLCLGCDYDMEWISITDRLPEENTDVICFSPANNGYKDSILLGYFYTFEGRNIWWCVCRQDVGPFYPTHWMPLPKFPTDQSK